jgi:hypothetical protein
VLVGISIARAIKCPLLEIETISVRNPRRQRQFAPTYFGQNGMHLYHGSQQRGTGGNGLMS